MTPSLYRIEEALATLWAMRDEAEREGDSEQLKFIDAELEKYLTQEPAKVASIAGYIRMCEARVNEIAVEIQRLQSAQEKWMQKAERAEKATIDAMLRFGVKQIDGHTTKLILRDAGGKQALEVSVVAHLPRKYTEMTVTLDHEWFDYLVKVLQERTESISIAVEMALSGANISARKDAIREALKQRVVCPECNGDDTVGEAEKETHGKCQRCDGSGTIPASVPGAKLLPRKKVLVIE